MKRGVGSFICFSAGDTMKKEAY